MPKLQKSNWPNFGIQEKWHSRNGVYVKLEILLGFSFIVYFNSKCHFMLLRMLSSVDSAVCLLSHVVTHLVSMHVVTFSCIHYQGRHFCVIHIFTLQAISVKMKIKTCKFTHFLSQLWLYKNQALSKEIQNRQSVNFSTHENLHISTVQSYKYIH